MKRTSVEPRQLEIAYEERGTGLPVLLLHAFPLDHALWQPQLEGLSDCCRVIAPDLPGFGDSQELQAESTVEALADAMKAFLDAVGVSGPVVVGGESMGGYIAMAFARRHPDRLRALLLADTRAEADDEAAKANRASMIEVARAGGAAAVIERMLPKLVPEDTRTNQPRAV